MGLAIRVTPVETKADLEAFIELPVRLYRDHPGYVAPLALERRQHLSAKHNPYFDHAEVQLFLARRGGDVVGRISAQIDRAWAEKYGDFTAHFGFLDAIDDGDVFDALLTTAGQWAAARGQRRLLGPFSFSTNEETGLLVEGFDSWPALLMPYNPPWAGPRLESLGFAKAKDLWAYDYDMIGARPFQGEKLMKRLSRNAKVEFRMMDPKRFEDDVRIIVDIFNDAWSLNWGFVPMTEPEINAMARNLKPILPREMVWIGSLDGEPVCMIVALPNLPQALKGLDGKLLPFGWVKFLWRWKVKGLSQMRVILFGVRKAYRRGVTGSALALACLDYLRSSTRAIGYTRAELGWVLEDNVDMRGVADSVEGVRHKVYRVYEKHLAV
jgi:GNAT superfamily N-acetyltransferase